MSSPIVSCTDLRRVYGEGEAAVQALRGVSLEFPAGQFTAIMGPSGSGKSTLMHLLAGRKPEPGWLDTLVDTVGLRDRLTHRPSELSGGQQQRVAVARALISRPAVVFADEPTGNLDSHSSAEVLGLLRRAADEFGQTVIMVTHDAGAAAVADRVLVLRDGEVVHDGAAESAEDLLDLMKQVA